MPIVTLEADGRPARARKEVQRLHERAIEASRRVALVQAAEREHEERLHELRAEFEALSAGEPGGGAARREWNLSVRVAGTAMRSQGGILARAIAAARAAELDASTAALQLKRAEEAEAALAHEAAVNRVKYEAAGARRADLERRAAARAFAAAAAAERQAATAAAVHAETEAERRRVAASGTAAAARRVNTAAEAQAAADALSGAEIRRAHRQRAQAILKLKQSTERVCSAMRAKACEREQAAARASELVSAPAALASAAAAAPSGSACAPHRRSGARARAALVEDERQRIAAKVAELESRVRRRAQEGGTASRGQLAYKPDRRRPVSAHSVLLKGGGRLCCGKSNAEFSGIYDPQAKTVWSRGTHRLAR